jgi:hypothetical protein
MKKLLWMACVGAAFSWISLSVAQAWSLCLVIEDTPAGVRSGKAAGACVVALQTTKPNDLLIAAGADWIVKDCSSLCLAKALLDTNDRQGNLIIDATLSGSQPFNKADSREGRS